MNTMQPESRRMPVALAIVALTCAGTAQAAEYWLCAKETTITMPDDEEVVMWGFAADTEGFGDNCAAEPTVPGPLLVVPHDEAGLIVHLSNRLPAATSIVIPGQMIGLNSAPVMFTPEGDSRPRVRSFTAETAANGGTATYTWGNLQPGTYLYHSGTHPQIQVQMGLYGAMKHDAGAGRAYSGVAFDHEALLLFSEIDPVIHAAVAVDDYGPGKGITSTVDYAPRYFLVNGRPHTDDTAPITVGRVGERSLIRLLNAGLRTHVPVLNGQHLSLVAEDGKPYPYAREQYSVTLPALKTVDAILTPVSVGALPIFDRRLDRGMLAYLAVAASDGVLLARDDRYSVGKNQSLTVGMPGVLANDDPASDVEARPVADPHYGELTLSPEGGFSYTPYSGYSGGDSFTYRTHRGEESSNIATVTITIVNHAPEVIDHAWSVDAGGSLNVTTSEGVLSGASDADGDGLTAELVSGPSAGTLMLDPDGSFSYAAPATAGTYTFSYRASDGELASAPATGTLSVIAATLNTAPVAVDDKAAALVWKKNALPTTVVIDVLNNDYDPDAPSNTIARGTVSVVTQPNKGGTVAVDDDGNVSYTPKQNFRGSENFTYTVEDTLGAVSNRATVTVNVK